MGCQDNPWQPKTQSILLHFNNLWSMESQVVVSLIFTMPPAYQQSQASYPC